MSGRANLCVPVTGRGELDAGRTGNPLSSLSQPAADKRRLADGGVAVKHNGA